MKKIFIPTISTLIPKGLFGLLKPALLMLVLTVMGSNLSFGQVVWEAFSSGSTVAANTITVSHTYNGTAQNRMLIVLIAQSERDITSISNYGGQPLQLVGQETATTRSRTHIYKLLNPPTGTNSITINFSGNTRGTVVGIVTLSNVNLYDPHQTYASLNATTLTPSVSPASTTGDMVIDVISYQNRDILVNPGQTERLNLSTGSETRGGISTKPGATPTTTMGWSVVTGTAQIASMSSIAINEFCVDAQVTTTPLTCVGGNNGTITVTNPTGGNGTYEYRLDAGIWQSGNTFTGLAPGTYTVQIRDANNTDCTVTLGSYILATNPVVFDAASSNVFTTGSTVTLNHTTGSGNNRLMLVGVSTRTRYISVGAAGEEVTTVTYDGNNLIYLGGEQSNTDAVTYLFMLVEPPSGPAQLSITFTEALASDRAAVVGISSYSNVDLTNPVGSYFASPGNDANPVLTINSTTTNQAVFNVLATTSANTTVTQNSGQTQLWLQSTANRPTGGGYIRAGSATSTTFNYSLSSSQRWSLSGVAINPALVADLAVTKSINHPNPYIGEEITFSLEVTNLGCNDAPNTTVLDQLPDGYIYLSHTAETGSYSAGSGVWDLGTLNAGASASLEIIAVVANTGNYNNIATISADVVDNNAANNSASATITVCQAGGTQPLFNN